MTAIVRSNKKLDILDCLADFIDSAEGFVFYAYPWGQPGTFLEKEMGPDQWQLDILQALDKAIQANMAIDVAVRTAVQIAVKSGQSGVGKSALIIWIIQWFVSTRANPVIVVTANTANQLETKTWRELAKWHSVFVAKDLFKWTATRYSHIGQPETWFAAAIPWSDHNAEAFAGAHDQSVLMIQDEDSAIPQVIDDNIQLSMNAPEAIWLKFGNPTRNEGPFFDCFGKFRHRWITKTVDAMDSPRANKPLLQGLINDWGEDSDFVRVRVRGQFPRASTNQLIGMDLIENAAKYKSLNHEIHARIAGVDVARYGDCKSVIAIRQGRKLFPLKKFMGKNPTQIALEVKKLIDARELDYAVISGVGVGAGTVDYLNLLGYGEYVIEIAEGETAQDERQYFNKRAELYCRYEKWLKKGAEIPNDQELRDQSTSIQYGFGGKSQKIQIETKEMMRGRGVDSPDSTDAVTMTFEIENMPKREATDHHANNRRADEGLPAELREDSPEDSSGEYYV